MKSKNADTVIKSLMNKTQESDKELLETKADIDKINHVANSTDSNSLLINYIQAKVQECMLKDDLTKALAIIDYSLHKTSIGHEGLRFVYNLDIYNGYDDFAIEFIGYCEALHYTENV